MARTDDDVFGAPPRRKTTHEIGENLDMLSVDELAERMELLRTEIARLEAARAAKEASRRAADAFFKA
ncbi:MAG: hypothetical protein JWN93_710 [Hyphomicrobiales bacterium]|jgi:uncharacterized small protein (DUF1192 family)|nr:hypothetical protein [Hyphomicrobiales bacterium]